MKSVSVAFLLLQAILRAVALEFPNCSSTQLNSCPSSNIVCDESTHKCKCGPNLNYNPKGTTLEDSCVKESVIDTGTAEGGSSVTTVIVVLIFLSLIASALVFTVRRYNLVHWFRQNVFTRRDNNVMYEDVMIGQDDPPIAA